MPEAPRSTRRSEERQASGRANSSPSSFRNRSTNTTRAHAAPASTRAVRPARRGGGISVSGTERGAMEGGRDHIRSRERSTRARLEEWGLCARFSRVPGLTPRIVSLLTSAVAAAATRLRESEPRDLRSVQRLAGSIVSYAVEPAIGVHSTITLLRSLPQCPHFTEFREATAHEWFPSWMATRFAGWATAPDQVVARLGRAVVLHEGSSAEATVDTFARAVARERVRMRFVAHLENNAPVPADLRLGFSNGVVYRALGQAELEKLLEFDLFSKPQLDAFANKTVLEREFETELFFEPRSGPEDWWLDTARPVEQVHSALHAFKSGASPIALFRLEPAETATLVSGLTIGERTPTLAFFPIAAEELAGLSSFVDHCLEPCRKSLELAKDRLRDAESRRSPIDGIVDAFVGIEALLNSENAPELTMRVALNYACLCSREQRRARYRTLKDLYKVRSKIVHGDYKANGTFTIAGVSKQVSEIAAESKAILRDLIRTFVMDEQLRHKAKVDSAFWEERYFADDAGGAGPLCDPQREPPC